MQTYSITRTTFKVADFLSWQRDGTLDLSPDFQRRSVWKRGAKSLLIDTVVRGLPTPIIFLRDRIELESMQNLREVVDGQQRLRTLIAYVHPSALSDFNSERDEFTVSRTHNVELAGKSFAQLDERVRRRILDYEFSTHVLPSSLDDRDVLLLFARLNATGERLSPQELRNAAWFGEFKTLMYTLAIEQLERWRGWKVFSGDDVARMKEVELTSDMVISMLEGFGGKTQKKIDDAYRDFDSAFPEGDEVAARFRKVMDLIDQGFDGDLADSIYSREIWFQPLFYFVYEKACYAAPMSRSVTFKRLSRKTIEGLAQASYRVAADDMLPVEVADALRGGSSDRKSRLARLGFLRSLAS